MSGAFVSTATNGSVSVTIASGSLAAPLRTRLSYKGAVTASGTLTPPIGPVVDLTGTYDTATDTLNLTGSGYTLVGQADTTGTPDAITGGWTGPGGPGLFGCFIGTTTNPVAVYCGQFQVDPSVGNGYLDTIISGDTARGIVLIVNPSWAIAPTRLLGSVSGTGTTRNITMQGYESANALIVVTGTLDTTTNQLAGTWTYTLSGSATPTYTGTWSGGGLPGTDRKPQPVKFQPTPLTG